MPEIIFSTSKFKKSDGTDYSSIVDDDIYDFIKNNKCDVTLTKDKDKFYTLIYYKGKRTKLHKFIFGNKDFDYKSPKGYVIVHRNGDGLDNRRENLTEITYKQNSQNKESKNTYNGVSLITRP